MIDASARGAWDDLAGKLRPFISRRVRSPSDVDDVLQDVFLRMHRGLKSLQDEQRFGPWLYRIARSAIAEHQRAAVRHPFAERDASEGSIDTPDDDGSREAYEAVVRCIVPFVAALPPPYREAVTLAELEGVTQREAAQMLGISLSAMKSRVQRGREKLREALDRCCAIAVDVRGAVTACEPRACGCYGQASAPDVPKGR